MPIDARDAIGRAGNPARRPGHRRDASGHARDVAMLNAGTLRLDDVIKPGPISNYQLESIFLFSDETRVISFKLTGAGFGRCSSTAWPTARSGRVRSCRYRAWHSPYDPAAPSGSADRRKPQPPGWGADPTTDTLAVAFPVYPACEGGDGYAVPERNQDATAGQRRPARWTS